MLFAEPASDTGTNITGNTSTANIGGYSGGGSVRPMAVQHSSSTSAAGAVSGNELSPSQAGKLL